MLITSIKDIDKKKKLVYIDYQIGFAYIIEKYLFIKYMRGKKLMKIH